jgi:hypothetical protein
VAEWMIFGKITTGKMGRNDVRRSGDKISVGIVFLHRLQKEEIRKM